MFYFLKLCADNDVEGVGCIGKNRFKDLLMDELHLSEIDAYIVTEQAVDVAGSVLDKHSI